jgi:hypothetical protein
MRSRFGALVTVTALLFVHTCVTRPGRRFRHGVLSGGNCGNSANLGVFGISAVAKRLGFTCQRRARSALWPARIDGLAHPAGRGEEPQMFFRLFRVEATTQASRRTCSRESDDSQSYRVPCVCRPRHGFKGNPRRTFCGAGSGWKRLSCSGKLGQRLPVNARVAVDQVSKWLDR